MNQERSPSMSPERRIGVYLCRRDDDEPGPLDWESLAGHASRLPGVCAVRIVPAAEALDPEALARDLRRDRVDTVVVGGASPGFFKGAFTRALSEAGGDPERVRLASFREHGAADAGDGRALERGQAVVTCAVRGV